MPSWDLMWRSGCGPSSWAAGCVPSARSRLRRVRRSSPSRPGGNSLRSRPPSYLLPAVPLLAVAPSESSRGTVTTVVAALVVVAARTGSCAARPDAGDPLSVVVSLVPRAAPSAAPLHPSDGLVTHQLRACPSVERERLDASLPPEHARTASGGGVRPGRVRHQPTTLAGAASLPLRPDRQRSILEPVRLLTFSNSRIWTPRPHWRRRFVAVARRDAVSSRSWMLVALAGRWLNETSAIAPLIWFSIGFVVAAERADEGNGDRRSSKTG